VEEHECLAEPRNAPLDERELHSKKYRRIYRDLPATNIYLINICADNDCTQTDESL
jgi:hypothetical protein